MRVETPRPEVTATAEMTRVLRTPTRPTRGCPVIPRARDEKEEFSLTAKTTTVYDRVSRAP